MINPRLEPQWNQTYRILAPYQTHFRKATCEEINCRYYVNGWKSVIDERIFPAQAYYIRKQSGRIFAEVKLEDGRTVFTFDPGQTCFESANHTIRIDRPEIFVVTDGDRRGNPRGTEPKVFNRPEDFVDHFATHQDNIKNMLDRG